MSCRLALSLLFVCLGGGVNQPDVAAQQSAKGPESPREIAELVVRTVSDQPTPVFEVTPDKEVISSTISNDGQMIGFLTDDGVHTVNLQNKQRKSINVEITAPADLRLIAGGRTVAIWMPSQLMLLDTESEEVVSTFAPTDVEKRFINWTTSPNGLQIVLVTHNSTRYIINLAAKKAFLEQVKDPVERNQSSQAISDDGLRVLTILEPYKLSISNQDSEPPNNLGQFQGDEFLPGLTKLAASDTYIGIVGKDILNVLPMPKASDDSQSPVLMSGDFVCLFAQMCRKPNGERFLAALRSQLNEDIFIVSVDINQGNVARLWKLPEPDPHYIRWSLSGDRVCYSTPERIVVMEASALAKGESELELEPISKRLIDNKDFDALDEVASHLIDDESGPLRPFDRWYGHLSTRLIGEFMTDEEVPEFLSEWRAERPASELARLMIAHWHRAKGWAVRGDGFVATKTDEQLQQFQEHFTEAYLSLGDIVERKVPRLTIETALEISKGLGPAFPNRQSLIDKLCDEFPGYSLAHCRVVEMLMPRWGGSVSEVKAYIDRVSGLQPEGEADRMYAILVLNLEPYFEAGQVYEVFDLDLDRVVRGAQMIDLSTGEVMKGYRELMMRMIKLDRTQDAYDLFKHHTSCTPFIFQSYKYKGTASTLRRRFLSISGVGTDDVNAGLYLATKSLERRTVPPDEKEE